MLLLRVYIRLMQNGVINEAGKQFDLILAYIQCVCVSYFPYNLRLVHLIFVPVAFSSILPRTQKGVCDAFIR